MSYVSADVGLLVGFSSTFIIGKNEKIYCHGMTATNEWYRLKLLVSMSKSAIKLCIIMHISGFAETIFQLAVNQPQSEKFCSITAKCLWSWCSSQVLCQ